MDNGLNVSRRGTLAALGTAILGGCATDNDNGSTSEPVEDNDTETVTPEEPVDEENNEQQETNEEETEEETGSFTWQDILDHEQQYMERKYEELKTFGNNRDILKEALSGEPVGQNYNHKLRNWETSYSHGGQSWDLNHFTDMDLSDVDDFQDIINDAVTLGIHHYAEQIDYPGPSEASGIAARTAQLLIQDLQEQGEFQDHNLHMFGAGNDNHGFTYALSEQHGLYLIDSTSERSGKSGEGVLNDRAGYDRISVYDWEEIKNDSIRVNLMANFLSNSLYSTRRKEITSVRYNLDLMPEAMEIFDATETDNGDFLMNTLRPAKATLTHEFMNTDLDINDEVIMIDPDTLYDLPDFNDYGEENFEEYREELNQYTEVISLEEADGKTFLS